MRRSLILAAHLFVILFILWTLPAQAATFTVINTNDAGAGSLRNAAASAAAGDTIAFNLTGCPCVITLTGGQITLNKNLTINGPGAETLTVSGNNTSRVFFITGSANVVTINGLTVANGSSPGNGGGISNDAVLSLNNAVVRNSNAANGGGIHNNGTLNLVNSAVSNNMATNDGGGVHNNLDLDVTGSVLDGNAAQRGGGIYNDHTAMLTNSTLSGNQATGDGGGAVFNDAHVSFSPSVSFLNATIAGNSSSARGGGVRNLNSMTSGNTIFAQNTAPAAPDFDGFLSGSQGHNLIGNTSGSDGFLPNDLQNVNPMLGPLANNGGQTRTRALLAGSPAIDAGQISGAPVTDQRGLSRSMGSSTDIGAFEFNTCGAPSVTNTNNDGPGSLRCAVAAVPNNGAISFNLPAGTVITLENEIALDKPLSLDGANSNNLTISGNNATRVFRVTAPVSLNRLTIANGRADIGGAILNQNVLTLTESTLENNTATSDGGAVYNADGARLEILRSTLSGNSAGRGGALYNDNQTGAGLLRVVNSTIYGNTASVGGGIYSASANPAGKTIAVSATIAANNGDGGGISGAATIKNTIVAINLGTRPDVDGVFASQGHNLIGNPTGGSGFIASDLLNVSPMLGPLADNGGPTKTIAPLATSPAIDGGSAAEAALNGGAEETKPDASLAPLTTDQRGQPRPYDDPRIANAPGGDGSDIGAYEFLAPSAATVSLGGTIYTPQGRGLANASITLTDFDGNTQRTVSDRSGAYRFDEVETGKTYFIQVSAKRYSFAPRVVTVVSELTGQDFTGQFFPWFRVP
jgi:hypothetical protein